MENTARIHILGCAAVVVSVVKLEDWKLIEKHAPEALTVRDEAGNVTFRVTTSDGPGRLEKDHAEFSRMTTPDGYATITVLLDPEMKNPTQTVQDKLGGAMLELVGMEKIVPEILGGVQQRIGEIQSLIKVV